MRSLTIILLLALSMACTPLTEQQRVDKKIAWLEHEPDRVEKWGIYEYWCDDAGIMLWGPYSKKCHRNRDCIPHRMDWDFLYKCRKGDANTVMRCENDLVAMNRLDWRPRVGNNVVCTSRRLF